MRDHLSTITIKTTLIMNKDIWCVALKTYLDFYVVTILCLFKYLRDDHFRASEHPPSDM